MRIVGFCDLDATLTNIIGLPFSIIDTSDALMNRIAESLNRHYGASPNLHTMLDALTAHWQNYMNHKHYLTKGKSPSAVVAKCILRGIESTSEGQLFQVLETDIIVTLNDVNHRYSEQPLLILFDKENKRWDRVVPFEKQEQTPSPTKDYRVKSIVPKPVKRPKSSVFPEESSG